MNNQSFFLNDQILPADQASINIKDISILRGFAIFDFFRTVEFKPLMMDGYLQRFINSANLMDLPLNYSKEHIAEIIYHLIEKNEFRQAGVRLVLTGGYSENAFLPAEPNFMILIEPVKLPPKDWFEKGIKLLSHQYQREWSQIKTTNYLTSIKLAPKCKAAQAIDVLYHNQGELREVSRSNVFVIKDGKIATPGKHVLQGITRAKVIELATQHYPTEERPVTMQEVWQADEIFMTGTTKKVLPVVQIDEKKIADGKPGPISNHIMQLFSEFESQHINAQDR
jgi:branched-subunit amino acid aminotransferase/4-amino-4-deoxychorismate lyase